MIELITKVLLATVAILLYSSAAYASGHYESYQCGSHTVTQPVGGDGSYGGTIWGDVVIPDYCQVFVPDVYTYKGVLAMDDYGMAYGVYIAKKSFWTNASKHAIEACEKAKPFSKCHVVASVSGGALELVWDKVRGQAFWATADDLEQAKSTALAKCGTQDCSLEYWIIAPSRTTSDDDATTYYKWLPGKDKALVKQMLLRQNVHLYGAWAAPVNGGDKYWTGGMVTPKDAQEVAKDLCEQGNAHSRCKVVGEFVDTCSAIAYSKDPSLFEFFLATADTPSNAESIALRLCEKKYGKDACTKTYGKCTGVSYGQLPEHYIDLSKKEKAEFLKN